MKKVVSVLLLALLLVGATSATAFAHCGGGGYYRAPQAQLQTYEVCPIEDCAIFGIHEHDGVYYHCQNYGTPGYGYGQGYGHGYRHGGGWHW